ncbi:MAG: hypothetical protein M1819_000556 [Sarea resinae]|nr:MAG: hypothetical protein M1819_000556 [Sarea resinae]
MAEPQDDKEWVVIDDDPISEESSFYGDEDLKASLESAVAAFSPLTHTFTQPISYPAGDTTNRTPSSKTSEPARMAPKPLYNPYEGERAAWQLDEPIASFLARLPPLTSLWTAVGPWIWVANPYSDRRATDSDLAGYTDVGTAILSEWESRRKTVEGEMAGKAKATITRRLGPEKKEFEEKLLAKAREKGVTSGKWMLFPSAARVNETWAAIVTATVAGQLGSVAKVATKGFEDGGSDTRLICVYTDDFSDMDDVKRVLQKLVEMDLVGGGWGIYYKCDAYTHLGINSKNEWGFKASLYSSKELLTAMNKEGRTVEGGKKRKGATGDLTDWAKKTKTKASKEDDKAETWDF